MRLGLVVLAVLAGSARADTLYQLTPELELGAGYDSNVLIDEALDPHSLSGAGREARPILHLAPQATAHLAASAHVLDLSYLTTLRFPQDANAVQDHLLRATYRSPSWRQAWLELTAGVEHGSVDGGPSFTSLDGGLGGRLRVSHTLELGVATRGIWRGDRLQLTPGSTSTTSESSGAFELTAGATVRLSPATTLVPSYTLTVRGSDLAPLDETNQRAAASVRGLWLPSLTVAAEYGLAIGRFPQGGRFGRARTDVTHDGTLELTYALSSNLDTFVRLQGFFASSNDNSADVWRVLAIAGVSVHYGISGHRHRAVASDVEVTDPAPGGGSARVHFTAHGDHAAREAAVVGDFDDWDPARGVMQALGNGRFEATFDVPPGRHQFAFVIDGQPVTPDSAEGTVSDGFGGKNAVFTVTLEGTP